MGGRLPTDPLQNNIAGINDVPAYTTPTINNPVSFTSEENNTIGDIPSYPMNDSSKFTM